MGDCQERGVGCGHTSVQVQQQHGGAFAAQAATVSDDAYVRAADGVGRGVRLVWRRVLQRLRAVGHRRSEGDA